MIIIIIVMARKSIKEVVPGLRFVELILMIITQNCYTVKPRYKEVGYNKTLL